jgi:hypothetical protein
MRPAGLEPPLTQPAGRSRHTSCKANVIRRSQSAVRRIIDRSVDSAVDNSPRLNERLLISANLQQAGPTMDA